MGEKTRSHRGRGCLPAPASGPPGWEPGAALSAGCGVPPGNTERGPGTQAQGGGQELLPRPRLVGEVPPTLEPRSPPGSRPQPGRPLPTAPPRGLRTKPAAPAPPPGPGASPSLSPRVLGQGCSGGWAGPPPRAPQAQATQTLPGARQRPAPAASPPLVMKSAPGKSEHPICTPKLHAGRPCLVEASPTSSRDRRAQRLG